MKNKNEEQMEIIDLPATKTISIAYLILVHRLPQQFKRMFVALYDSENYYLINIDKKADATIGEDIRGFLKDYTNVSILTSENVTWGGYSMVQAELDGIKYLLNEDINWEYFINLSGQDYPLKSQEIIRNYLTNNKDKNFIKIANQKNIRPETMNRIEHYYEEANDNSVTSTHKRPYLDNVTPYIGGQWMILTRKCCEFISTSSEVKKYEDYYANTLIPDESFFQTVLMNSSFDGTLVNNDKRAIIWVADGDIKLRPKTYTDADYDFLVIGENLFARKFDDDVDEKIINRLQLFFNIQLVNN